MKMMKMKTTVRSAPDGSDNNYIKSKKFESHFVHTKKITTIYDAFLHQIYAKTFRFRNKIFFLQWFCICTFYISPNFLCHCILLALHLSEVLSVPRSSLKKYSLLPKTLLLCHLGRRSLVCSLFPLFALGCRAQIIKRPCTQCRFAAGRFTTCLFVFETQIRRFCTVHSGSQDKPTLQWFFMAAWFALDLIFPFQAFSLSHQMYCKDPLLSRPASVFKTREDALLSRLGLRLANKLQPAAAKYAVSTCFFSTHSYQLLSSLLRRR